MVIIRLALMALALVLVVPSSNAETLTNKTYSHFPVGGRTGDELQRELWRQGPVVGETGRRHPGATRIKLDRVIDFEERGGKCRVKRVLVKLQTKLTLPRWTDRKTADRRAVLVWNTFYSDIKRHEERHAEIARQWARKLEKGLRALRPQSDCVTMQSRADTVTRTILQKHSADQDRFDRTEAASFERRINRILRYKASQLRNNK